MYGKKQVKHPSKSNILPSLLSFFENKSDTDSDASIEEELWVANLKSDSKRQFLNQMLKTLPESVQDRVVALKNLHFKQLESLSELTKNILELEKKCYDKMKPLLEESAAIINGDFEPPEQELEEHEEEVDEDDTEFNKDDFCDWLDEVKAIPANSKGVPEFWFTVFRCIESLSDLITTRDEDALKKLKDVICVHEEEKSFTLEFHFAENDYFTNKKLSKKYYVKTELADYKDCNWDFEGEEVYKCTGCEIDWKPGKNLLDKIETDDVEDDSDIDSFFAFFNPPSHPEGKEDEEIKNQLLSDYEIGQYLRSTIIPNAISYYTGDIVEEDKEEDESSDEDETSSEDSDEDDYSDEDESSSEDESSDDNGSSEEEDESSDDDDSSDADELSEEEDDSNESN